MYKWFFLAIFFSSVVFASTDMAEYKDGFKEGWEAGYAMMGHSVPPVPPIKNPAPRTSNMSHMNDNSRGYAEGYQAAIDRVHKE